MRAPSLPFWLRDPTAPSAVRSAPPDGRLMVLVPALMALGVAVAFAVRSLQHTPVVGALFPTAAIAACVFAVPMLEFWRERLTALQSQAVYVSLASLTPWLVFALQLVARDGDGGFGGALAGGVLVMSSIMGLPIVLPLTLVALRQLSLLRAGRGRVLLSAALLGGLALYSAAFAWRHPTAQGVHRYPSEVVALAPTRTPGLFTERRAYRMIEQRRAGNRCATRIQTPHGVSTEISHACSTPVRIHSFHGDWDRSRYPRPLYDEMFFLSVGDQVISSRQTPRALLFTAPFWEWIVMTLAAIALALHTTHKTFAFVKAWRDTPVREVLAENGVAYDADRQRFILPAALAHYNGPVVILDAESLATPFRGDGIRTSRVYPGALPAWKRALDATESLATSFALAVMWLPAAPLLAAPFLGMLSPLP